MGIALAQLPQMHQRLLRATLVSYNAAFAACAKGRPWEQILGALRAMDEQRLGLDQITHGVACRSCMGVGTPSFQPMGQISVPFSLDVPSYGVAISAGE